MAKKKPQTSIVAIRAGATPQQPLKEAYIRFMAPVNPQTSMALLRVIDSQLAAGVARLHLMISSPGGMVFHGLSISNFLRGAPVEVYTYNFGSVDSIGVVIFCSGTRRLSVPHARFLIHGVSLNVSGNLSFDEKSLEEKIKSLKIDYQNIAKVIADTCGKKADRVMQDMNNRTTLNPQEAMKYGLVHEVRTMLFPAEADLCIINEDGTCSSFKQPPFGVVPQPPFGVVQHVTAPATQSFTESEVMNHGTFFSD
jgi:ATP-dependent protease ClpP protease subunit